MVNLDLQITTKTSVQAVSAFSYHLILKPVSTALDTCKSCVCICELTPNSSMTRHP